jgi:chromosome segregation ATPase
LESEIKDSNHRLQQEDILKLSIQQYEQELTSLKLEKEKLIGEAERAEVEKSSSKAEIERLSSQVSTLESEIEESNSKLQHENTLKMSIQQSLTLCEQELASLRLEKDDLASEVSSLSQESKSKVKQKITFSYPLPFITRNPL